MFCIKSFDLYCLDLRGVFSPSLLITDPTTTELAVIGNNRSIEYFFASDARYYKLFLFNKILECYSRIEKIRIPHQISHIVQGQGKMYQR